jgi:hypothetical protein
MFLKEDIYQKKKNATLTNYFSAKEKKKKKFKSNIIDLKLTKKK